MRFTRVPDGGPNEYMDPVTKDVFTNASRLMVLKPTGARPGLQTATAQQLQQLVPLSAALPQEACGLSGGRGAGCRASFAAPVLVHDQ